MPSGIMMMLISTLVVIAILSSQKKGKQSLEKTLLYLVIAIALFLAVKKMFL